MNPLPFAIGAAIWIVTAVAYGFYQIRLRKAVFTSGTVTALSEVWVGDD